MGAEMANKAWKLHLVIGVEGQPAWITIDTLAYDLIVTAAETEDEARLIADKFDGQGVLFGVKHPWLLKSCSTCLRMG